MAEEQTAPLTVKAAACELGVSAALVYLLVQQGLIRHERHGVGRGTIRIPPDALAEYRKSRERGGAAPPPLTPPPPVKPPRPRHLRLKP